MFFPPPNPFFQNLMSLSLLKVLHILLILHIFIGLTGLTGFVGLLHLSVFLVGQLYWFIELELVLSVLHILLVLHVLMVLPILSVVLLVLDLPFYIFKELKAPSGSNRLFTRLESNKHLFVCVYLDGWVYCKWLRVCSKC